VFNKCAWSVVLIAMLASACGGSGTPTGPSVGPPPTALPTATDVLTGQVTDRTTSAPLPGARVAFSQPPGRSATADSSGHYRLIGLPAPPSGGALVWATADGYEEDIRYYSAASQDFRLYPIERIMAGDSTVVTVRPDDSLCGADAHAPGSGGESVCRTVRIVPTDGVMTVEALPIGGGARPRLVVLVVAGDRLLVERLGNPVSIEMTVGTEVIVYVEMGSDSPTTEPFTLTTSMAPR